MVVPVRGAIKKKLPNFGHCPNMGERVSGAAKPFIEKRYGHVFRGEGGRRTSSKVVSCKKVFGGVPLEVLCVKIIYILHALSEKFHSSIYQKLILYFKLFVSKCPNYGMGRGGEV